MERRCVLYLEGFFDLQRIFERMCETRHYKAHSASTAAEARVLWMATRYDAVIVEDELPGESGLEFCRWIREQHPKVPIFLFTGHTDPVDTRTYGVTERFKKHSGYDGLMSAIAAAIDSGVVDPAIYNTTVTDTAGEHLLP